MSKCLPLFIKNIFIKQSFNDSRRNGFEKDA